MIEGKTVAGSGSGEATARHLAALGASVVLGARRADRLEALAAEIEAVGGAARAKALDVTSRDDTRAFVEFATAAFGKLDVLVNNAGVMPLSPLDKLKFDEWDRMIDVNIRGVLHGIAAALPIMQAQGFGQVINLSSIGGHAVHPTAAVYSATKFAVCAISEGLRLEVGEDLRVTVISPGVTTSDLAGTISDPATKEAMDAFRAGALPADAIARAIAFAIDQPGEVDVSEIIVRPTSSAY